MRVGGKHPSLLESYGDEMVKPVGNEEGLMQIADQSPACSERESNETDRMDTNLIDHQGEDCYGKGHCAGVFGGRILPGDEARRVSQEIQCLAAQPCSPLLGSPHQRTMT